MSPASPALTHLYQLIAAWRLANSAPLHEAGLHTLHLFDVPAAVPTVGVRYQHRDGATLLLLLDPAILWPPDVLPWLRATPRDRAARATATVAKSLAYAPGESHPLRPLAATTFQAAVAADFETAVEILRQAVVAQVFHTPGVDRVQVDCLAEPSLAGVRVLFGETVGDPQAEWVLRLEPAAGGDTAPGPRSFRVTSTVTFAVCPIAPARRASDAAVHGLAALLLTPSVPA